MLARRIRIQLVVLPSLEEPTPKANKREAGHEATHTQQNGTAKRWPTKFPSRFANSFGKLIVKPSMQLSWTGQSKLTAQNAKPSRQEKCRWTFYTPQNGQIKTVVKPVSVCSGIIKYMLHHLTIAAETFIEYTVYIHCTYRKLCFECMLRIKRFLFQ